MEKVQLSEEEWRDRLSPEEYHVLREAGTEAPFTGEYTDTETTGVYKCRACGAELFRSNAKFHSGCGWPSFYQPTEDDAVILLEDRSLGRVRTEVRCAAVQQPPRPRVRGRRLRRADRPALVHQLGVPDARRGVSARPPDGTIGAQLIRSGELSGGDCADERHDPVGRDLRRSDRGAVAVDGPHRAATRRELGRSPSRSVRDRHLRRDRARRYSSAATRPRAS